MRVLRLCAQHYRNLAPLSLTFAPDLNLISGKNAQGKTNLLESLWLFTGGHSFRGSRDGELPHFQQPGCELTLDFFRGEREQQMTLSIQNNKRSFTVNGVEKKTGAELIGKFCGVIFSPAHLSLVQDGPALRRSYLDGALCQSRPAYAREFVLYQRTLRQRNMLLKEIARKPELRSTLSVWNQFLAQRGLRVIQQRLGLLEQIVPFAQSVYAGISQQRESLDLHYHSTVGKADALTEEQFLARLEQTEKSDLLTGFTSVGPHRDDLELEIDGRSARLYGSQGQQRSAVLSLKLAEADVMEAIIGEKPVILLDDVMSELDQDRQDYLLHHVRDRQIFLTCCDPEAIRTLKGGKRFQVHAGQVTEWEGSGSCTCI